MQIKSESEVTCRKLEENEFDLVKLLFGLIYLPNARTHVHPVFPRFEHVFEHGYAFSPSSQSFSSGIKLSFGRNLKVETPIGVFSEKHIYVTLDESERPVSITRFKMLFGTLFF